MNDTNLKTIEQIEKFLIHSKGLTCSISTRMEKIQFVQTTLLRFNYRQKKKKEKSILRLYIKKFTQYSRPQLNRLIEKFYQGTLFTKSYKRNTFTTIYKREDIVLLAKTDKVHKKLSGTSTKEILRREFELFHKQEYERLKEISVSHIYNLRKTLVYKNNTSFFEKTKYADVDIGKRTKPHPNGKPGFIRIDTVHQGDRDGIKGVYHINTVDQVTQWEVIGAVSHIEYSYMVPLIQDLIDQYPFEILGFHSDNGSEYINKEIAHMLNKLLIQFTKSRPRRHNDNALVETKNGSVIRKHMGYAHIPKINAYSINSFYKEYFNIYLNFHRPCHYATTSIDKKGKERKKYLECVTPYEKLKSLKNSEEYLKSNISFEQLNKIAYDKSDNDFAKEMNAEKERLFKNFIFPQF